MREPYRDARRYAESHFCRAVGSTVYVGLHECPYCGDDAADG